MNNLVGLSNLALAQFSLGGWIADNLSQVSPAVLGPGGAEDAASMVHEPVA